MRTITKVFIGLGTFAAADAVLAGAPQNPEDTFLDFAAWTSVNEVAETWLAAPAASGLRLTAANNGAA